MSMRVELARLISLVGLGVGAVLGLLLARALQADCARAVEGTAGAGGGPEVEGDAVCGDFVCFYGSGRPVEDGAELAGCVILVKTRRTEQVVKFDRATQKVVVLEQWQGCTLTDSRPHVHRRIPRLN
jgi:hypothetical protein